jgi:hypothetical protein
MQASRWTKDGKDRIYVNAVDPTNARTTLGYVDIQTGRIHVLNPGTHPQAVWDCASAYAIRERIGLPAPKWDLTAPPSQTRTPSDLANRSAGHALTAEAATRSHGFLARLLGRDTEAAAWRKGAEGERTVGRILDKLPGWNVLHNVNVGSHGADIDHVLFGPSGIYTVNTKTHTGHTVTVNASGIRVGRDRTDYIAKARIEAERTSRILTRAAGTTIPVTPLIVIIADSLTVNAHPGVTVLEPRQIRDWLAVRATALTSDQITWLYTTARDPHTWRPG